MDSLAEAQRTLVARDGDLDPTETLLTALKALWEGSAIDAPKYFHLLAMEMDTLHVRNDGAEFAPSLVDVLANMADLIGLVNTRIEDEDPDFDGAKEAYDGP